MRVVALMMAVWMRFWLLPFCVSCEMLCPYKLLFLLLWFLLLLFVALIQVFRAVSSLVVLVKSVKMLQSAVSSSAQLPHARLQVQRCLSGHEPWSGVVPSSLVEGATVSSTRTQS